METQLRQYFARGKWEIANCVVTLGRRWIIGGGCETRGQDGQEKCKDSDCWIHVNGSVAARLGFV